MKLRELLEKAKEKGYIPLSEVSKYCDVKKEDFINIEEKFKNEGIDIIPDEEIVEYKVSKEDNEDDLDDDVELDDIPEEMVDDIEEVKVESIESLTSNVKTDDPVRMYLKDIGNVDLLDSEEEMELAISVSLGKKSLDTLDDITLTLSDEEIEILQDRVTAAEISKNNLVEANLRLVVSIAKRYVGRGMQFLDLIQEGNMGLMKAVDKFDHEKSFKFSTYATWWIRQAITRAVADQARTIRIPVHMVETINKLVRVQRQLVQELSREPSPEEVANKMGITVEKVQMIQKIAQEPISLESPVGEEEDSSLGDFVSDPNGITPYEFTSNEMLKKELDEVLATLNFREEQVLRMRFGLSDGRQRTLEEVGKEFGVTRERIRQIEAKALRKLKHPNRSKKLTGFITKR